MTATATNPETGERVVLIGDKWKPFAQSATNAKGEKTYLVGGQWVGGGTEKPELDALGATAKSINTGLLRLAGSPVDVINTALGMVGLGSKRPVGGSEQLLKAAGSLAYPSIEQVPQELRPIARAGEVIGGSVPIAAAPFAVTRAISQLPKIVQPIVQAARQSPLKFAAVEAGSTLGSAQGAAAAELLAPGQPIPALAGEVAGGFVNPVGALAKGGTALGKGVGMVMSSIRRSGREEAAAKAIQDAMLKAKEDPAHVAEVLRQADLEGVSLTSGQKSESPTLLALEATAAAKNPDFDAAMRARTQENMASLRKLVGQLETSGDPTLLKEAARMRGRYFDNLLGARLQAAEKQMERAAKAIHGDKAAPSVRASAILDDAIGDARKAEAALWEKVSKDESLSGAGIAQAHRQIRANMLPEEPLPPSFIEQFVERVGKQKSVTSGEVQRFRSQMLGRARESRAQNKWSEARIYEDMADGALADLAAMQGGAAEEARAFSRSLHNTFSRTFASDALAVKGTGADRIPPEAVLQKAYGNGGVLANKRFQQLEEAAQFAGRTMIQEQEEFLRAAATASVDPQTGRVNPRSLEGFLRSNERMLERFPTLKRDLANASSAEQTFRQVQVAGDTASKAIQQRAVFSEVLRNENPAQAVRNAVNSPYPQRSYQQLVKLARRGPEGAVDGLKASTLDHAARSATSASGGFSFERYAQVLNDPVSGRGPSLMQMMRNGGVISGDEASRMGLILREAARIEKSVATKAKMSEVVDQPSALFDLVVRIVGANIGGASILGQSSGAPIVLAGAGSKTARYLFEKLPRTRVMDVIQEASQNPQFMARLLEKPRTPARAEQLARQINAFLIQAGMVQDENAEAKRVPD